MGSDPTGAVGAVQRRPWVWILGLLMAVSAALLLTLRSRLGFFLDDWALVVGRLGDGFAYFVAPHNEHIIVLPALIYRASLEIFGMEAMPLQVVSVAFFLASVGLLYLWIADDLDEMVAVAGCAVILFLGVAYQDLLWAFQIGYSGSMAAGIGALLLLRRDDRQGDVLACIALTVSVLFSSLGIPFVVAAALSLLLDARPGGFTAFRRRVWSVAVPTLIYLTWWLGWGRAAENSASFENLLYAPLNVVSAFGLAIADLTGIYPLLNRLPEGVYFLLGLLAIAGLVILFRKRKTIPAPFLVAAAAAIAFWGLAALNTGPGREFTSSRYQYPGAVLTLMMFSGAFSGLRAGVALRTTLGLVAVFAVAVNLNSLRDGYLNEFKPYYEKGIAAATAFEISRDTVNPDAAVGVNNGDTALLQAGAWLEAADRYGSGPAWSAEELADQNETVRQRVDEVLLKTLPVRSEQVSRSIWTGALGPACSAVESTADGSVAVEMPGSSALIEPEGDVVVSAGRFGTGAEQSAALGAAGRITRIYFPADRSDQNWRLSFTGDPGRVRVCPTG